MSQRYVKVEDAEVVESSNSTALTIFVISLIAIFVIAMAFWQPWASQPQSNSTTIIREKEVQSPDSQRPIIVNPPSTGAGDTNVTIHNEIPKTQDPPAKSDAGSDSNTGSSGNNDAANSDSANQ